MRLHRQLIIAGVAWFMLTVAACTTHAPPIAGHDDVEVILTLTNTGSEPLRCGILFGHWVERDLGPVPPGEGLNVALRRQITDGALFVPRDSDGRRMMVENLICGPFGDWWERRADLPLLLLRAGSALSYGATCAVEARTTCSGPIAR